MIYQSSMCHLVTIVIAYTYLSCTLAIRVDWNTNPGPIVPPTSTLPPVPKPPFREPAPVWEDQSNDVPNPNTYKYVLPPPSRPKLNNPDDDRQKQLQQEQQQQQNQHHQQQQYQQQPQQNYQQQPQQNYQQQPQQNYQQQPIQTTAATIPSTTTVAPTYGTIVHHPNQIQNLDKSVSSLTVQYIPNVGNQYVAVVPSYQKVDYLNNNDIYDKQGKYDKYDKYNDKYLAKLKKFKAYEQQKVKYVPYYNTFYNYIPPQPYYYQELPKAQAPLAWNQPYNTNTSN